eukprot:m.7790 g.7790  ORF g.7790 m.7790 type:complete len:158 (-) comp6801_c0_seq1:133-606(-)
MDVLALPTESRGRDKQQYTAEGHRLVCGCVPFKFVDEEPQVLVITSKKDKNKWILPKGGWDSDETATEAAIRETFEEAGVLGDLRNHLLLKETYKNTLMHFYPMLVTKEVAQWPEKSIRDRKWVALEDALKLIDRPVLRHAITSFLEYLPEAGDTSS